MSSTTEHSALAPKDRVVSIDLARVMAAFFVMGMHFCSQLGDPAEYNSFLAVYSLFGNPSGIFFAFAGYFACRSATWKKALANAGWCLAAFLLWNLIHALCLNSVLHHFWRVLRETQGVTWYTACGLNHFFFEGFALHPELKGLAADLPLNPPTWFMRDLICLFLLSPLIARWARYVFPALFVLCLAPTFAGFFECQPTVVLAPYTILLFSAGAFLRSFSAGTQQKVLRYTCPWMVLLYIVALRLPVFVKIPYKAFILSPVLSIAGVCALYWLARWLELISPAIARLGLALAPVTFLVYVAHTPIIVFLPKGGCLILLYPVFVYALAYALFRAMKRWTPWALHLVAYYKLRPADRKPSLEPQPSDAASTGPDAGGR